LLSIAILDDNIKLLEEYEQTIPVWLKRNNIRGEIVILTTEYKEFIREVRRQSVNVCIIDINLQSDVNGLYVAKCLRKEGICVEIIFCTGMLEFIQQAFDVNAYHFITKPVGRNLEKCLVKLNKELEMRENSKRIIDINSGSRIYYVPLDTIIYMQREGTKTIIHTSNRVMEVYDSLDSLVLRLDDPRFVKCRRSVVINKDYIDYVDKKGKCIALTNGFKCKLGIKFAPGFYSVERRSRVYEL
jgi:DNA-binding LytR/AlgR family response regulator